MEMHCEIEIALVAKLLKSEPMGKCNAYFQFNCNKLLTAKAVHLRISILILDDF